LVLLQASIPAVLPLGYQHFPMRPPNFAAALPPLRIARLNAELHSLTPLALGFKAERQAVSSPRLLQVDGQVANLCVSVELEHCHRVHAVGTAIADVDRQPSGQGVDS
jgi:hypothetical protein